MYAKTPTQSEADAMANSFIESPVFEGTDFDWTLVKMVRDRNAVFKYPDQFQLTEKGQQVHEDMKDE